MEMMRFCKNHGLIIVYTHAMTQLNIITSLTVLLLLACFTSPVVLAQESATEAAPNADAQPEINPTVNPALAHYLLIGIGGLGDLDVIGIESANNFYAMLGADTEEVLPEENITLVVEPELTKDGLENLIRGTTGKVGMDRPLVVLIFTPMLGDQNGRPHIMTADVNLKKLNDSALSMDEIAELVNPKSRVPVTQLLYYKDALEFPIPIRRLSSRDSKRRQAEENKNIQQHPMLLVTSRPGFNSDHPITSDPTLTPVFRLSDVVLLNAKHTIVPKIVQQFKPLNMYRELINTQGQRFRYIKAGTFQMGSAGQAWRRPANEAPRHYVKLTRPFYIATHETTIADYERFTKAARYQTEAEQNGNANTWQENEYYKNKSDRYPANYLSHDDAEAYAKWLTEKEKFNYRLPSEAEWEYIGRAGKPNTVGHVTGPKNGLDRNWVNYKNYHRGAKPVGSFMPNPWGLYDTHGNVSEWTSDRMYTYTKDLQEDPDYSQGMGEFIIRGGGWSTRTGDMHLAARMTISDTVNDEQVAPTGFRLLLEIP